MNRRLQRRIVSVVAAVAFFATGAIDAYGLHSCPHHDALPAPAHAANAAAEDGARADHAGAHAVPRHRDDAAASAAPAVHAAVVAHAPSIEPAGPSGTGAHDDHGPCSCTGECSITAPPAPAAAPHITIAAPLTAAPTLQRTATQPRVRTTPHVLPYANAPPHR